MVEHKSTIGELKVRGILHLYPKVGLENITNE